MSVLGTLISFFPVVHITLIGLATVACFKAPGILSFGLLLGSIYFFPLVIFRIHNFFFPLRYEPINIQQKSYVPWWGAYMIQSLFIAVPTLEALLRICPGVYSAWLRAWGSQIGKGVVWTPRVEITDRSAMNIGDFVLIGHHCKFSCHVIRRSSKGELMLDVKPITIGKHAVVGATTRSGPGVTFEPHSATHAATDILPYSIVKSGRMPEFREVISPEVAR